MAKSNVILTYGTLAVLAILALGVFGYLPGQKMQAGGGTVQVGTNGGAQQIAVAPCGQNPPQFTGSAYYTDVNNGNTKTTATTVMALYKKGNAQAFFNSPITPNTTTQGLLACGDELIAVFGNQSAEIMSTGGTSYYRVCKDVTIAKDAQSLEQPLFIAANASMSIANDSGVFGSTTSVYNVTLGTGGTYSQLTARVRGPTTSGAEFGTDGWALCTRFNSSAIAKVIPNGGVPVAIGSVKALANKDTVTCYDMSSLGILSNGKVAEFGLSLSAPSGVMSSANQSVDYILVDKVQSVQNGACVTSFTQASNPAADTGALDIIVSNATTVNSP